MTLEEFERRPLQSSHALTVLVDEATGKKRVIHDGSHDINGSHDIRINHRIKCLDKLRMRGGREKRYLLSQFKEARDVVVSLI